MVTVPPPVGLGRDTSERRRARARLARVLWDSGGERRLPSRRALRTAITACDPRDVWWVCEMSDAGPVYFLPTREWVEALGEYVDGLGARSVLEVAAGDGFLARCLARARPRLRVIATDSGAWDRAPARMSAAERRAYRDVEVQGLRLGAGVERLEALRAVREYRPDLVIVSWPPPGTLVERLIRAPARYVLEIGADGDVCGAGPRTWRLASEILAGPLEDLGFCRLDARGDLGHTTVTAYRGAR